MDKHTEVYALTMRAMQPPVTDLGCVYYMNALHGLNEGMLDSIGLLKRFLTPHTKLIITGHDPGDPELAEPGKFDDSKVPIQGGTRLAEQLRGYGLQPQPVFGAFTGYADSGVIFNTQTELACIARYVKQQRWQKFGIYVPDVHTLRVAVTTVSCLLEINASHNTDFWLITASTQGWHRSKIHSGNVYHESGYDLAQVELDKCYGDKRYRNLVPAEQVLAYFDRRDASQGW